MIRDRQRVSQELARDDGINVVGLRDSQIGASNDKGGIGVRVVARNGVLLIADHGGRVRQHADHSRQHAHSHRHRGDRRFGETAERCSDNPVALRHRPLSRAR